MLELCALITVQTKGILSDDETADAICRLPVGSVTPLPETSALSPVHDGEHHNHCALGQIRGASYFDRVFRRKTGRSPTAFRAS